MLNQHQINIINRFTICIVFCFYCLLFFIVSREKKPRFCVIAIAENGGHHIEYSKQRGNSQ